MWYKKTQEQLAAANYTEAARLLATVARKEELLVDARFNTLLQQFPPEYFEINPDLILVRALSAMATEQLEQVAPLLQRASHFYLRQQNFDQTVDCYCRLVALYQKREDFRTAYAYVQEASALLDHVTAQAAHAQLSLQLAELCPDIGRLREGLAYAQQALAYFRRSDQVTEHFQALLLLALIERQLGEYATAEAHLEMARHLQTTATLGVRSQAALLSAEAHLAWYRGQFIPAIDTARRYVRLVQRHHLGKQQVYAQTLLGNLYRATHQYDQANETYAAARRLVQRYHFERYLPWLDVQESWCALLRGDYEVARRQLQQALDQADHGQVMSFNVNLAIFYLLTERFYIAQDLLNASLEFYSKSGDELAVKLLQWYLALVAIKTAQSATALALLPSIFDWMATQNVTYFPLWWHPQLVGEVCTWALATGTCPVLAERILVQQIGHKAIGELQRLQQSVNTVVQERVGNILTTLQNDLVIDLTHIRDRRVRQTIEELLQSGQLQRQGFTALQLKLTTATQQQRPNPVLLAVFGLYLHDYSQSVIAGKLGRAHTSIRNYITTIYQIFGLSQHEFPSPMLRKRQLVNLAIQSGFIGTRHPHS